VASRRAADSLIASGSVRVNGERPPATGLMIEPEKDVVTVDGRRIQPPAAHRYVMLNKPLGAITTARDQAARTTVLDVIGKAGAQGHRLFPVGRLDADSTGLLLLTDDGELSYRLTHPRYKVPKEYVVTVGGVPTGEDVEALRSGVRLTDGTTAPADVEILRKDAHRAVLRVVIREGRHRQVRRMLQAVGHKTVALKRIAFGPLRLSRMRAGDWRVLSEREVAALRRATRLEGHS
jgi:23S rRNA pseudouridine2605 synthase